MGFAQDDSAVRGTKEKYPFVGIAPCYKSSCCQVLPKLRISKDIPHDSFRVFPCLERLLPWEVSQQSNTMVTGRLGSILAAQGAALPFFWSRLINLEPTSTSCSVDVLLRLCNS